MVVGGVKDELSIGQIFFEFFQYVSISQFHNMRAFSQRLIPGSIENRTNYKSQLERSKKLQHSISLNSITDSLINFEHCVISIVIPTYNEEASIVSTIQSIIGTERGTEKGTSRGASEGRSSESEDLIEDDLIEIIVSDGGSKDNTISVCRNYLESLRPCPGIRYTITTGGTNRANSQNIGAEASTGDIILFLHADSILPDNWELLVRSAMSVSKNLAGCFKFKLFLSDEFLSSIKYAHPTAAPSGSSANDIPSSGSIREIKHPPFSSFFNYLQKAYHKLCLFIIEEGTNIRSLYFRLPYGDQALFFRRTVFLDIFHGFRSTPLMEDYDLIHEVRKYGNIVTVRGAVKTSARRWEKNGFIWNTFLNQVRYL